MPLGIGIGISPTLTKGVGALRGDAWADFTTQADGAPSSSTGDSIVRAGAGGGVVQASVASGVLVAAASGGATTAAYTGFRQREDAKSMYCEGSLGDSHDSITLLATADVNTTTTSALHIVFNTTTWSLQYWSNTSFTTVTTGSYVWPANDRKRFGWRIVGNDFYILQPDGLEVGPFTSAAAASRTDSLGIFEHFRDTTGAPGSKIYVIAANRFADPVAAGRSQMLVSPADLTNAAWTKSRISVTLGQPDSTGGATGQQVLETATTGFHDALETVTKASAAVRRYTFRAKAQAVNGRWGALLDVFNGPFSADASSYFNLGSGALGATLGGTFTRKVASSFALGSGFQIQLDFISDADASLTPSIFLATADTQNSYAGDVTKGIVLSDLWLFERPI